MKAVVSMTVLQMPTTRQLLALLVVYALAGLPVFGQQGPLASRLRIIALEGNGAVNYIPNRTATTPVVEVRDENDRPVEGAKVVFTIPPSGAGATFDGGQLSYATITDFRGQAAATGYTISDKQGPFTVEVTATFQDRSGRLLIRQTNTAGELPPELGGRKPSGKLKWILLAVGAGAGAGLGIWLATRGNNSPISVGTGPITVGGPR